MSELPAWSLPAGAAKDIALASGFPVEITREWALGGSTGKGVRVCILDSGVDASHPFVGHVESAVAVAMKQVSQTPLRPSSINPGRLPRSCSDHAKHTLSRSPNVIGRVCRIHAARRAPPSGRVTASLPSARSAAAM